MCCRLISFHGHLYLPFIRFFPNPSLSSSLKASLHLPPSQGRPNISPPPSPPPLLFYYPSSHSITCLSVRTPPPQPPTLPQLPCLSRISGTCKYHATWGTGYRLQVPLYDGRAAQTPNLEQALPTRTHIHPPPPPPICSPSGRAGLQQFYERERHGCIMIPSLLIEPRNVSLTITPAAAFLSGASWRSGASPGERCRAAASEGGEEATAAVIINNNPRCRPH